MLFLAELALNGAAVGLMYALVALGIVLIYKSSGVVNLAQGAFVMAGAYVAWAVGSVPGIGFAGGLAVAAVGMFGLGWLVERLALRRMIGQPVIMLLMLTLGLEVTLRGLFPGLWGPDTKPLPVAVSQAPVFLGDVLLNRTYLLGSLVALVVVALLMAFFRTRPGTALRAVSDDHLAAWAVGIPVERAIAFSWAVGGVVAAAGGVLWALVQGVDWSLSLLLIKALSVAVLGGLDSPGGAVLAGVLVGVSESVISGYLDPLVGGGTKEVVAALVIFLTVLVRPYGLFGQEVIERV